MKDPKMSKKAAKADFKVDKKLAKIKKKATKKGCTNC